jgi:multidrug efflux pump subunit AcrB
VACGVDLNITALMGMTMIIGIGTEMAIFYVSEFEAWPRTCPRRGRTRGQPHRLRPITMTTLAAILTLLPLALAIGQGRASSSRWPSRSSRACCCNIRWCCWRCRSSCA